MVGDQIRGDVKIHWFQPFYSAANYSIYIYIYIYIYICLCMYTYMFQS